jgi:hypothetical protein
VDEPIDIGPETVHVQLLNPDGTATDVPFTRKEFDRLSSEAVAANMEIAEYIKQKIEKTVVADHVKILHERIAFLQCWDGNQQILPTLFERLHIGAMSMRDALEAVVAGLSDDEDLDSVVSRVVSRSDTQLASEAFSRVVRVLYDAVRAEVLERDLQKLRERFTAAEVEIEQKTVALRSFNREASADRLETRVAEARAAERAAVAAELETLRSKVAKQQSEIDELRASKKKLREALERAKEHR